MFGCLFLFHCLAWFHRYTFIFVLFVFISHLVIFSFSVLVSHQSSFFLFLNFYCAMVIHCSLFHAFQVCLWLPCNCLFSCCSSNLKKTSTVWLKRCHHKTLGHVKSNKLHSYLDYDIISFSKHASMLSNGLQELAYVNKQFTGNNKLDALTMLCEIRCIEDNFHLPYVFVVSDVLC